MQKSIATKRKKKKLYIIIAGAIASGKTTLALNLARIILNCFYLDKDDFGPMAEQTFAIVGEEYDRQSPFFKEIVRNVEYDLAEILALRGLLFNDCVIVNTPYTGEILEEFKGKPAERLTQLRKEVNARGGELMVIFIDIDEKTAEERLNKRLKEDPEAAVRTPHVYKDIPAFLKQQNLRAPEGVEVQDADRFFEFHATDPAKSFEALKRELQIDSDIAYDEEIAKAKFMEPAVLKAAERQKATAWCAREGIAYFRSFPRMFQTFLAHQKTWLEKEGQRFFDTFKKQPEDANTGN